LPAKPDGLGFQAGLSWLGIETGMRRGGALLYGGIMRKGSWGAMGLAAALILAPALGHATLKRFGGEWVVEPSGLGAYGKIEVQMTKDGFEAAVAGKPDKDAYEDRAKVVQDEVQEVLEDYAKNFKGTPGGKTLTLQAELTDLWTGSAGSRLMGVAGHMDYMITWKDGDKIVGQLDTKQPITSAVKKGAKNAAKQIIKYMKKKLD
jgi:hypothetical protein